MRDILLYVFGGAGALIYGFPIFLAAISAVPPARFALATLVFSVFVGAMLAPVFVPLLGHWWPWIIDPEPYPLAIGVGLASNPLVPIVVKKVTAFADAYTLGRPK